MMKTRLAATLLVAALPLMLHAQTANTPGGSVSTGTPLDQSKSAPQKTTPSTTATSPTATNPSGSTSTDGKAARKARRSSAAKDGTATPPGDVPTYPAPAKDGTPTK